jgi:hypothetical protein
MSEVVLFHHIPKTAGSTMKHVLWAVTGGENVYFAMGHHQTEVPSLCHRLERPLSGRHAVVAHTGYGLQDRLPARHRYRMFTIMRDPIDRTVSEYYAGRSRGRLGEEDSLQDFLSRDVLRSHNAQTAFFAGLTARHNLDGAEVSRDLYDAALLERAKRNLDSLAVAGLTDRFDETLLLLRDAFGWPSVKTLYQRANVSARRRAAPAPSGAELEAVRASNLLDLELYEYARARFERQLSARVPNHRRRLRRFRRLNVGYRLAYPLLAPPTKALLRSSRG